MGNLDGIELGGGGDTADIVASITQVAGGNAGAGGAVGLAGRAVGPGVGVIIAGVVTADDLGVEDGVAAATEAWVRGVDTGIADGDAHAAAVIGRAWGVGGHEGDALTQMRLQYPVRLDAPDGGIGQEPCQGRGGDAGGKAKLIGEALGDGQAGQLELV